VNYGSADANAMVVSCSNMAVAFPKTSAHTLFEHSLTKAEETWRRRKEGTRAARSSSQKKKTRKYSKSFASFVSLSHTLKTSKKGGGGSNLKRGEKMTPLEHWRCRQCSFI